MFSKDVQDLILEEQREQAKIISEIQKDISEIKLDLREHMYRTKLAENRLDVFENEIKELYDKFIKHLALLQATAKIFLGLSFVVGLVISIKSLVSLFAN